MISFRQFALRRGERLLMSDVDLALHAGYRVGVVGRNGAGKSSLFAALMGQLDADAGALDLPNKLRIASVAQETPHVADAALDFVLSGDAQLHAIVRAEADAMAREDWEAVAQAHQQLAECNGYDAQARAAKLMHGLGFASHTHQHAVADFSGGWRVRLNVARALMMPSDLLLLDEPTNHLDLDAVVWLEDWLKRYDGTLLVISHDREFLDNITTHTLHLHEGRAKLYTGNYTAFERQRAEHLRLQQITHEKEQAERAHLQSFIDRFKAKASKAKQAQSRMKRLEKLAGTEAVRAERGLRIHFPAPARMPNSLLTLRAANCGYVAADGTVSTILQSVGFHLQAGDRIGLLGVNGAGKSTLVKTLVGELQLLAGERVAHPDLRIGYFAQHTLESLQYGSAPIDHLRKLAPDVPTQDLRDFLGQWNFPGNRAFEVIDTFSGGEKARLALALLAWQQPNVLLLDEPTNHLDLEMREALAEALSDFDGAIVMVSHDRHLIGLVCENYWRVHDGVVDAFEGDLDDYAAWLRNKPEKSDKPAPAPPAQQTSSSKPSAKTGKTNTYKIEKAEQRVAELEAQLNAITAQLGDSSVYGDAAQVQRLQQQQTQLQAALEDAEAALLALYG